MLNTFKAKSKQSLVNLVAKQVTKYADIKTDKQEELSAILNDIVDEIGVSNLIFLGLKAKEISDLR